MERPRHIRVIAIVGTVCFVLGFVVEEMVSVRMKRYGFSSLDYADGVALIIMLLLFGVATKCYNILSTCHLAQMAMFDENNIVMKQQSWMQTQVAVR